MTLIRQGVRLLLLAALPLGALQAADAEAPDQKTSLEKRIALFWNKEFTDSLTTGYKSHARATASLRTDVYRGSEPGHGVQVSKGVTEVVTGAKRLEEPDREQLAESTDWAIEGAFSDRLIIAGATLVDRNVIMRTLGKGESYGPLPDIQSIETSALLDKADLLMEVLVTEDASSLTGLRFRVSVTNIESGRVTVRHVTVAAPLRPPPQAVWQPTENGYEKIFLEPPPISAEEIGHTLAEELLAKLAAR
ncbi:MAG: hypothetical protein MI755_09495 [Sphingomonadales bacterium]|nr:hypothetical protein [Sphingomonadales bacterium]